MAHNADFLNRCVQALSQLVEPDEVVTFAAFDNPVQDVLAGRFTFHIKKRKDIPHGADPQPSAMVEQERTI